MYSANRLQLDAYAEVVSGQLAHGVEGAVNQIVYELREAADAVADVEPLVTSCSMPISDYSPQPLVRLFNALSSPSRPIGSLGIIQVAPNSSNNGKVSWQVASGYGCQDYMYAYADPANYPTFTGYCYFASNATPVDTTPDYVGTDWGLKKEERELLVAPRTKAEVFLPVFPLLGYFTLTYERTVSCQGQSAPYAAVFAEQSIAQLDTALRSLTISNDPDNDRIAFILERSTGALVSASEANLTQRLVQDGNNNLQVERVFFQNATDERIKEIARSMEPYASNLENLYSAQSWNQGRLWVTAVPYQNEAGLNWVLVVAVPQGSFLQTLANASAFSIGLSVGMILIGLLLTFLGVHFLISRPLNRLQKHVREGMGEATKSDLDDSSPIVELDEMLLAVKGYHSITSNA